MRDFSQVPQAPLGAGPSPRYTGQAEKAEEHMTALSLQLLGPFEARLDDGRTVAVSAKKARALLAYLALAGGKPVPRARLASLLWAFSSDDQARTSLRQTLALLRKCLMRDGVWLVRNGDTLAIDLAGVEVDALQFEALAAEAAPAALERASVVYRGEFLDGMSLREEAFEVWLRSERARLQELMLEVLAKLFEHSAERGDYQAAARAAHRLLALDPLREDVHRALMRLHGEHGQRGLALKQFGECCDLLRRELDVSPAPETCQLHEQMRDQGLAQADAAGRHAGPQAIALAPVPRGEMGVRLPPDKPSLAVLPFENLSGDTEKQYFSDGISSDIVIALGRFRDLFVISDESSFAYRDARTPVRQIGRELGVRHVLNGHVRAADQRIRVSATLIDTATSETVWAESYDRVLNDVFAVQDEITRSIAATLAGHLEAHSAAQALAAGNSPLSVYDYLLRGRHLLTRGSRDDVLKARAMFKHALALDPDHARTHVGLAHTYWVELASTWSPAPELAGERLFELARRAVALDSLDSRGHVMLAGAYHRVKGNYDLAAAQYETAMTLNPNDIWNYCAKGFFLTCVGMLDEGISCENQALRLNPLVPDDCLYTIGVAHYHAGRYDEALTSHGRMSNVPIAIQGYMAACYARLGSKDEARAAAAEFLQRAEAEFSDCPGKDVKRWQEFWMRVIPVKSTTAREDLFVGLRKAELPV